MYCCGVVFSIDTREYHRYIFWVACWFFKAVMLNKRQLHDCDQSYLKNVKALV